MPDTKGILQKWPCPEQAAARNVMPDYKAGTGYAVSESNPEFNWIVDNGRRNLQPIQANHKLKFELQYSANFSALSGFFAA